jgi:hypothetical protein
MHGLLIAQLLLLRVRLARSNCQRSIETKYPYGDDVSKLMTAVSLGDVLEEIINELKNM